MKSSQITPMTVKTMGWFLWLAAAPVSAQTNQTSAPTNPAPICCRHPYRALGAGTVNLTPLFEWWRQQGGETSNPTPVFPGGVEVPQRPLSAWKRITGSKTAEVEGAWVLQAEIASRPGTRTNEWILLRNPPAAEEDQYYNLKALLPLYDTEISNDLRLEQADEKAADQAVARAKADARNAKWTRQSLPGDHQLIARKRAAAAAALKDQQQAEPARDLVRKQLAAIPSADGQYQVDCFALETGRNRRGQLVFDAGAVLDDDSP
jgi:hypothetical protein